MLIKVSDKFLSINSEINDTQSVKSYINITESTRGKSVIHAKRVCWR